MEKVSSARCLIGIWKYNLWVVLKMTQTVKHFVIEDWYLICRLFLHVHKFVNVENI